MKRRLTATTGSCERTFSPSCQEAKKKSGVENCGAPSEQSSASQYAVVPFARVSQTIYRDEHSGSVLQSEILEGDGPGSVAAVNPIGSRTDTSLDDLLDLDDVKGRTVGSLPHPSQLRKNKNGNIRKDPRQKRRNLNVDEHRDHLKKKFISLYGEDAQLLSTTSCRLVVQNHIELEGRSPGLLSRRTSEESIGVRLEEFDQLIHTQSDTPMRASVQGSATRSMLHNEDALLTYHGMHATRGPTQPHEPRLPLCDEPILSHPTYAPSFSLSTPTRYSQECQPRYGPIIPAMKSDPTSPDLADEGILEDIYGQLQATPLEQFLNIQKPLYEQGSNSMSWPEGYFNNIPESSIPSTIPRDSTTSQKLLALYEQGSNSARCPEDYYNNIPESIIPSTVQRDGATSQKLPVLQTLYEQGSNSLPWQEGYFNNIPEGIIDKMLPYVLASYSLIKPASLPCHKSNLSFDNTEYETQRVSQEWYAVGEEDICGANEVVTSTSRISSVSGQAFEGRNFGEDEAACPYSAEV